MDAHQGPVLKKRRGGIHQRLARSATESVAGVNGVSRVLLLLLYKVAWGFMQMEPAIEMAKAEVEDILQVLGDTMGHFPYPD